MSDRAGAMESHPTLAAIMLVFLNGQLVERDDARVSAFDAGFQHAIGLFETMLVRNGRVFRGDRHIARLDASARALGLSESLRTDPLLDAIALTLERNGMAEARVRLTITGGDLNWLQSRGERRAADPTVLIVAQPPTAYPAEFFERGVLVTIADDKANPLDPFAGHKSLSYWPRVRALQLAGAKGASEALWFTVANHLAGGCVSNVFLVREGLLVTPPARGEEAAGALPSPVLPGVTREALIALAEARSLRVERRVLAIADVLAAEEIFLTNSSWGVLPIRQVEGHVVGDGEPGPVTRSLREAWTALVDDETRPEM